MNPIRKIQHLFSVARDVKEVERWIFSLVPLMVSFSFFVLFMAPVKIEHKDVIYIIAITSGFVGLQTYWIIRGWNRNEGLTIILGIIGIAMAIGAAWAYIHLFRGLFAIPF
jgi:uncharacterized membrane protein